MRRFTASKGRGGKTPDDRVETPANSYIAGWRRRAGSPDWFSLDGFWTDATRHHRHPPDACSRPHWRSAPAALGRRRPRYWLDRRFYDEPRHGERAHARDRDPGGPVLLDESAALNSCGRGPQANLYPGGWPERADGAGCTAATWRRRRLAQPVARRPPAGDASRPVRAAGAAGAAVEVTSQPRGRKIRPLQLLDQE